MNQALAGHLVHQRHGPAQCVLDLFGCFRGASGVDGGADVAQRAAKAGAKLPVVFAALQVLTVRFERGLVTGHCWSILVCLSERRAVTRAGKAHKLTIIAHEARLAPSGCQLFPFSLRISLRCRVSGVPACAARRRGRMSLATCRASTSSGVGGGVMSS